MASRCIIAAAAVCLLALQGADATVNIRGSALETNAVSQKKAPLNWGTVGMGAGIGALVAGVIIGGAMFAMKKKEDSKEDVEGSDEKGEPLLTPAAEEEAPATDYAALLKAMASRVTEEVGPKFDKGGSVRNVLETRMETFNEKAKNFLLSEMNDSASAVMREMEAEEPMMLLEWNNAVESNFPPASILIAGVLSPTVINFMSFNHLVQMCTVALPLLILCVWAAYTDHGVHCVIPTLTMWLYTQTVLAALLFVGHGLLLSKLSAGKKQLQAKREEIEEGLKGTEDGGFANLKEQFIGNTIILQEALLVENNVRHSFWNMIVGLATVGWILTTVWNLVLICGWTFVPGVVAFHPDAAEVAHDSYCGAWATVLVLKISMLLSVLYLFLNLATVIQWLCDMMIESKGFSNAVMTNARKADKDGTGLPVVEMLAKAFLLRGGDESIISRLAVVQHHKKLLKNKQSALESQLSSLTGGVAKLTTEEEKLTDKVSKDGGGDLAAQVSKLSGDSVDYDSWAKQGAAAISQAEAAAAGSMGDGKTDALEVLYEKINAAIEEVKNSDTVQAAQAAAQEAAAAAQAKMNEAYEMLNDPEFQAKMKEYADAAQAKCNELGAEAQGLADAAIAAATDPELQKALQDGARKAMEQAQDLAKQAQDAANDPELQKKLKDAMDLAQAKAQEAANNLNDPEMQKKMMETANATMAAVQEGADSASQAMKDASKAMEESAMKAMEEASAAAQKAAAAATDPKIVEAALKKLKEAQEAAERAAAAAQDPATKKKFEEAAQRAVEQAKTVAADQGAKASAAVDKAAKEGEKAVKEVAEKAKGKKGKK